MEMIFKFVSESDSIAYAPCRLKSIKSGNNAGWVRNKMLKSGNLFSERRYIKYLQGIARFQKMQIFSSQFCGV